MLFDSIVGSNEIWHKQTKQDEKNNKFRGIKQNQRFVY